MLYVLHLISIFSLYILIVFSYDLKFEGCGNNGWTCFNNEKGAVKVNFSCAVKLEGYLNDLWQKKVRSFNIFLL